MIFEKPLRGEHDTYKESDKKVTDKIPVSKVPENIGMISARIGPITGTAISPVVCKDEDKVCSTNTPKTVLAPVIITLAAAITL